MQERRSRELRESFRKESPNFVTDKEVNLFICEVDPKQNKKEDYERLLSQWNQCSTIREKDLKEANEILAAVPKKQPNSRGSNICQVCYEEMSGKKNWCRICGNECCQKCTVRSRVLKAASEPIIFCEKCDKQYMFAMIIEEEQKHFNLREKAFTKLAEELEMVESLLSLEKEKMNSSQEIRQDKSDLIDKMNKVTELTTCVDSLKNDIIETKKKLDWGEEIKGQLKKKLKKLKKNQSHSFASSVHDDDGWAPPRADADETISVENLNESILNSILENEVPEEVTSPKPCSCIIF